MKILKKNNISEKQLRIQEKLLDVSKKQLNIATQHKKISKHQATQSMSLKEQRRRWFFGSVFIPIIIASGILGFFYVLLTGIFSTDHNTNDLKIDIYPTKIKLNEAGFINFEINFTNTGEKNITGFNIFKINLYRIEDDHVVFLRQLIVPWQQNQYVMRCSVSPYSGVGSEGGSLPVGQMCSIKFSMNPGCSTCFDDKDKTPMMYIYIDSFPPTENRIINLSIY